jgi:hypothetical protein
MPFFLGDMDLLVSDLSAWNVKGEIIAVFHGDAVTWRGVVAAGLRLRKARQRVHRCTRGVRAPYAVSESVQLRIDGTPLRAYDGS